MEPTLASTSSYPPFPSTMRSRHGGHHLLRAASPGARSRAHRWVARSRIAPGPGHDDQFDAAALALPIFGRALSRWFNRVNRVRPWISGAQQGHSTSRRASIPRPDHAAAGSEAPAQAIESLRFIQPEENPQLGRAPPGTACRGGAYHWTYGKTPVGIYCRVLRASRTSTSSRQLVPGHHGDQPCSV